jgi:hypothetical protein
VDWKECDRKPSRPNWMNICIRTDGRLWWHDLIWVALWFGTDEKECSHDLIWTAMRNEYVVAGSFHDEYEVLCGL